LVTGLFDRALLDARDPRRYADNDSRLRPATAVHAMDEVADHLLGHIEVGDDPIPERAHGRDVTRCPADHPLRIVADGEDVTGVGVQRDNGRLIEEDPLPANVDERVRGSEVNGHIPAQVVECAFEHDVIPASSSEVPF
jgi:hypothetical protein